MAKRLNSVGTVKTSRSKKTKKRLDIKKTMLKERAAKKARK